MAFSSRNFLVVLLSFSTISDGKRLSQTKEQSLALHSSLEAVAQSRSFDLQNLSMLVGTKRQAIGHRYSGEPLPEGICDNAKGDTVKRRYSLRGELGKGAFGTVYRAWDESAHEEKAVKSVHYLECNDDVETCEKKNAASKKKSFDPIELEPMRLKLPFVADLETVFREGEDVWIGTRLYEGKDLWHHVQGLWNMGGGMWLEQINSLAAQMAYGIWQLHKNGFLHGDIKPDNILFVDGAQKQIVLADFGLSSRCTSSNCCPVDTKNDLCTHIAGTPKYMAPGIVVNDGYGFEVDWWAFGLTVLDMVDPSHDVYYKKDVQAMNTAISRGVPSWGTRARTEAFKPLKTFLTKLITLPAHKDLFATPGARSGMESPEPADHPILSDPFFVGSGKKTKDEINKFWKNICKQQSLQDCDAIPEPQDLCALPGCVRDQCSFAKYKGFNEKKLKEKLRTTCVVASAEVTKIKGQGLEESTGKVCASKFKHGINNKSLRQNCCRCLVSKACVGADCIAQTCPADKDAPVAAALISTTTPE